VEENAMADSKNFLINGSRSAFGQAIARAEAAP